MNLDSYIRAAVARLASSETPLLDARVIARHALGLDDAGLIAEARRELTSQEIATLDALIARRAAGEPVAYITGEKEFRGLTFRMAPGVLVPRPDSETLIEAAVKRRDKKRVLRILDLGTGTGCLLASLLDHFETASGIGVDQNEAALALARQNIERLGFAPRARLLKSDWFAALEGRFDVIVSNPPYIAEGDRESLPIDVRHFEDGSALFAGARGLDAYRAILAEAPRFAAPGALIILELGSRQMEEVQGLAIRAFPGAAPEADADLAGRPRALVIDLSGQKNI